MYSRPDAVPAEGSKKDNEKQILDIWPHNVTVVIATTRREKDDLHFFSIFACP